MSDDNIIPLHCPKCGERGMQASADLDVNSIFICAKCGSRSRIGELKTASGKTLLDHVADMARDAFRGIKGFKPTR